MISMLENIAMADDGSCKISVRVYHDPKNLRTFKKLKIQSFPKLKKWTEVKECLFDTYCKDLNWNSLDEVKIGYIGYSNAKYDIESDEDLEQAYKSSSLHKDGLPLLFLAKIEKKRKSQDDTDDEELVELKEKPDGKQHCSPSKSKSGTKKKRLSQDDRVMAIADRLAEAHGDKWPRQDYRLWAVAIDRGDHLSYEKPPAYPHFQSKQSSTSSSKKPNAFEDAIVNIARVLTPATLPSTTSSTEEARNKIFDQIERLKKLHKDESIPDDVFVEQQAILCRQLKKLGDS